MSSTERVSWTRRSPRPSMCAEPTASRSASTRELSLVNRCAALSVPFSALSSAGVFVDVVDDVCISSCLFLCLSVGVCMCAVCIVSCVRKIESLEWFYRFFCIFSFAIWNVHCVHLIIYFPLNICCKIQIFYGLALIEVTWKPINWLLSVSIVFVLFSSLPEPDVCARCQNPFQSHIFPSFFFCPRSNIITNLPYRSTNFKVQISPVTAFVDIAYVLSVQELFRLAASALRPLLCVRCCCVYLSIYLFVCLPVSMSLCVCLAFCLSVCTSGCLPLSVSSPSVAWASVALHEMNALFPPGFRCGVPPGWRLPPSPQALAHLQLQLDGCHVPRLLHGELHWGGELWCARKSSRYRI